MARSLKYAIAVGLCLCTALGAPAQDTPLETELWSEATLYRDEWGVPHVYGSTPRGLGFAFGYAQAEDHIEPMLLAYRAVTGRLAEVKGESAAASDAFALRMGHRPLAEQALGQLDEVTRGLCEGFATGVNAWLASHIDTAPEWAEGVAPYEVLALWHAFVTGQSPLDIPGAEAPPRPMETGNAWAVAPSKTPEQQTVLVINPHQFHEGPFLWYEAHLSLGDYDVYGATLYGLPLIIMGHNPVLGWGMTPNLADTADVFDRSVGGSNATRRANDPTFIAESAGDEALLLEYYSKARPYYVKTDSGLDERLEPVHVTETGPIIEHGGLLYLWRIQGYGAFGGLRQLIDMGRAPSLGAFQEALLWQQLPPSHLVYGDAYGNIFYSYAAPTGYRQQPDMETAFVRNLSEGQLAWKEPLPTAMQAWGWNYLLGVGDLPYVVNPDSGYVQACGASPWAITDAMPYTPDLWPAFLSEDPDSYRAQRVRQLLRGGARSFRDNQSMLYDLVAPAAYDMKGILLATAAENPELVGNAHPDLAGLLGVMEGWDNLSEVSTPGMTAYHLWWAMFRARTPEIPSDAALQQAMLSGDPAIRVEAVAAAGEAARMMRNEFDRVALPWGEAHRIRRGDREEPIAGSLSGDPIFAAGDFTFENGGWLADYGYGFAMVVQFGERPNAVSMVPFGASDVKGSPHYDDQLDLMLSRRFKRTRYAASDVMRNATVARGTQVTLYPLGVEAAFRLTANAPMTAALKTMAESPGFLPAGSAAFSLYVQPQAERPADSDLRVEMSFYVPEEFCLDEDLPSLALYRFEQPGTWTPLAEQHWDFDTRALMGTDAGNGVYAVLGPEQAFANAKPEVEGEPEGEASPAPLVRPTAPATTPAPTATSDVPLPDPATLLPPVEEAKAEEKPTFKFEWANPPPPKEDTSSFEQTAGEKPFKFERKAAPATETPMAETPKPDSAETPGQAPSGSRQLILRGKNVVPEAGESSAPKRGRVEYGLPPHVLERQEKLRQQQEQQR